MPESQNCRDSGHFETRYSKCGFPFQIWVRDMPRVDNSFLDCVVYLYPSEAAAEDGHMIGGSGFLAGVPVANDKKELVTSLLCVVTNRHVVEAGNMVVRVNTGAGGTDTVALDGAEWIFHPDGDDLAVCPIGLAAFYPYKHMQVSALNFIGRKNVEGLDIGIGDDVFTVGRFISRQGKKINIPALRFGNISQMPIEPIKQENGFEQESYLVEVRSLSGSSGSPVFFYGPAQVSLEKYTAESQEHIFRQSPLLRRKRRNWQIPYGPSLLGISYCYIFGEEPVTSAKTRGPVHDWYVRSNSGMMGVIPAWKLADILWGKQMTKVADKAADDLTKAKNATGVALTSSPSQAKDANPQHREDFTALLGEAGQKRKRDE